MKRWETPRLPPPEPLPAPVSQRRGRRSGKSGSRRVRPPTRFRGPDTAPERSEADSGRGAGEKHGGLRLVEVGRRHADGTYGLPAALGQVAGQTPGFLGGRPFQVQKQTGGPGAQQRIHGFLAYGFQAVPAAPGNLIVQENQTARRQRWGRLLRPGPDMEKCIAIQATRGGKGKTPRKNLPRSWRDIVEQTMDNASWL